jgi:hypothetical protein
MYQRPYFAAVDYRPAGPRFIGYGRDGRAPRNSSYEINNSSYEINLGKKQGAAGITTAAPHVAG